MGHVMHPADGQQYMAWIQGTGGAGATGGGADALLVQQEQERFAFDAFKAEADVSGEPLFRVAVQGGMRDFIQARNQAVPENGEPGGFRIPFRDGLLQCGSHADDAGQVSPERRR